MIALAVNGLHIPQNFVIGLGFLLLGSDAERSGDERVSVHGGDGAEGGPDPVDDHVLHVGVPAAALMHYQSELLVYPSQWLNRKYRLNRLPNQLHFRSKFTWTK